MEVLGVGPLELFFILIIALIFLGPRDMVKTGRTMGKYLRKIVMSPTWRMVQQTSRELRTLPNRMIREAGMEEDIKDLGQLRKDMENQIGSIRKPFSAASSEINEEMQAAQSELAATGKPAEQTVAATQTGSPVQTGLSAWTTPPTAAQSADDSTPAQEPGSSSTPDGTVSAPTEPQTPNES